MYHKEVPMTELQQNNGMASVLA